LRLVVADAQQPKPRWSAKDSVQEAGLANNNVKGVLMLRLTNDGRLLGFDLGDWSLLLAGFMLAGFSALFF
jgi:hypothetical protein